MKRLDDSQLIEKLQQGYERDDVPVYNPVVRVWEVKDAEGSSVGLFFGDYYARDTKRSGASYHASA